MQPETNHGVVMLVLSRRKDQSLVIDGTIVLRVLEIRGNTVRLGIEAPEDVTIVREELLQRSRETPTDDDDVPGAPPRPNEPALAVCF
jgi:carbon storage regulator